LSDDQGRGNGEWGKGFEYLKWIGNIVVRADSISALK
jgi:hypothetical protein